MLTSFRFQWHITHLPITKTATEAVFCTKCSPTNASSFCLQVVASVFLFSIMPLYFSTRSISSSFSEWVKVFRLLSQDMVPKTRWHLEKYYLSALCASICYIQLQVFGIFGIFGIISLISLLYIFACMYYIDDVCFVFFSLCYIWL